MASILQGVEESAWIAGEAVSGEERLAVTCPFDGTQVGSATLAGPELLERALDRARAEPLSRFRRHEILERARELLTARATEFADLMFRGRLVFGPPMLTTDPYCDETGSFCAHHIIVGVVTNEPG